VAAKEASWTGRRVGVLWRGKLSDVTAQVMCVGLTRVGGSWTPVICAAQCGPALSNPHYHAVLERPMPWRDEGGARAVRRRASVERNCGEHESRTSLESVGPVFQIETRSPKLIMSTFAL
jgi:hypothetical protein